MSKEVDSLILLGSAHRISGYAYQSAADRIEAGLRYVLREETEWADGSPITDDEVHDIQAGAVFLRLGQVVTNHMAGIALMDIDDNPYAKLVCDIVDEISPFVGGDTLAETLHLGEPPHVPLSRVDVATKFEPILAYDPDKEVELYAKRGIPTDVIKRRGKVPIRTYSCAELQAAMAQQKDDTIAPDYVSFNDDLSVRSEKRDVRHIVERSGVKPKETQIPYYSTFNLIEPNATVMLADALIDLRTIANEIRQLQ